MGAWLISLALLVACSRPAPLPDDEDAGVLPDECDVDAGTCSAQLRTTCRADRLLAKAQLCEADEDCFTFTFPPNCINYGRCPTVAVSYRRQAQFSIDATRELSAFCNAFTCRLPTPCPQQRALDSVCQIGRCTLVFPDAGTDGGTDGGR